MVTAVSAGSATVRVDARVTGSSSVSFAVPQTRSDEAAVEQMVTVVDSPLRVALTADPAPAVEEGGENHPDGQCEPGGARGRGRDRPG